MLQMKEMNARSENIQTASSIPDVHRSSCTTTEAESSGTNQVKRSSKQRISTRDMSLLAGIDFTSRQAPN